MARSSVEEKYKTMSQRVYELLWLRILMGELGFNPEKPINLYYVDKAAITIVHIPIQHDCTKHVDVDRHFIKENLTNGIISMTFVNLSISYQIS